MGLSLSTNLLACRCRDRYRPVDVWMGTSAACAAQAGTGVRWMQAGRRSRVQQLSSAAGQQPMHPSQLHAAACNQRPERHAPAERMGATTVAPASRKARAMPSPTMPVAPVITATRPSSAMTLQPAGAMAAGRGGQWAGQRRQRQRR